MESDQRQLRIFINKPPKYSLKHDKSLMVLAVRTQSSQWWECKINMNMRNITKTWAQLLKAYPGEGGGGYFEVKRIGMNVGNPTKLPG